MKSISLGKLFGIKLELHWSFVLIALFVIGLFALSQPANLAPVSMTFFFLFFSVFLHELAHSVVSLQRGIKVKKIVLLPIGGVSLTDTLPEKPKDEFLIAIAGPAFNFAVAVSIIVLVLLLPVPFPRQLLADFPALFYSTDTVLKPLLSMPLFTILWWNLLLGSFNLLLPALPLDGGRVLRALLSFQLGRVKATRIVTKASSLIAIAMLFVGFAYANLLLMIIAFFVFFGSREEEKLVLMKALLKDVKLSAYINKKPLLLNGSLSAEKAVEKMLKKKQRLAVVKLPGEKYAVISAEELPELLEKKGLSLKEFLPETKPLPINTSTGQAIEKTLIAGEHAIPVTKGKKLAGLIEAKDLEKALLLTRAKNALEKKQHFKNTKSE